MDMQELERAWQGMAQRLEAQDSELRVLRRRRGLDAVRAHLGRVSRGQWVQLGVGLLVVFWAGGYWWARLGTPHLVVYGVAVHLWGIALLGLAIAQLVQLARVDYQGPVLAVQEALQGLRAQRIAHERLLLMAGFAVWLPLVLMVLASFGMDLWVTRPEVVWANVGVAAGLVALVAWITRRWRAAFERDAVGRHLREAQDGLDEAGDA